ncbi:hypothetical protein TNCV_4987791 [Trichonephila clavipes]|nr:hypothetical protein TNCV_4987791 [Trichonephila clavipes]
MKLSHGATEGMPYRGAIDIPDAYPHIGVERKFGGWGASSEYSPRSRGLGSLEVKVTDSWPACHEFVSSTAEDPPCRGNGDNAYVSTRPSKIFRLIRVDLSTSTQGISNDIKTRIYVSTETTLASSSWS